MCFLLLIKWASLLLFQILRAFFLRVAGELFLVDYTVVNGKITVREGRLASVDEEKLARDAQAKCTEYLEK